MSDGNGEGEDEGEGEGEGVRGVRLRGRVCVTSLYQLPELYLRPVYMHVNAKF